MPIQAAMCPRRLRLWTVVVIASAAAAAAIPAQQAARARPKFVLPAGVHALDELVARVAQLRGAPIQLASDVRKRLHAKTVCTYHEMELPAEAFEDVVSTLLLARGVAVVRRQNAQGVAGRSRLEALDLAEVREDLATVAERVAASQVLARPQRATCVITTAKLGGMHPMVARNMMRPMLSNGEDAWPIEMEADADRVQLTGTTDQVAFALRLFGYASGEGQEPVDQLPDWSDAAGEEVEWAGGRCKLSELVEAAGARIGANLVRPAHDRDDAIIELGESAKLTRAAWFARLGSCLLEEDFTLVPLVAQHRVFELRASSDDEVPHLSIWRALFTTPEAALKRRDALPIAVVMAPPGGASEAFNELRPMMAQLRGVVFCSLGAKRLVVVGPREQAAKAIAAMQGK